MKIRDLKNKRTITFGLVALFILIIMISAILASTSFMKNTIENTIASDDEAQNSTIRFDLKKLEEIGIIK